MPFHSDLLSVFKKYPFVHIDSLGQLSIIVPLTGAQRISENFSATPDAPQALYLFGDNTCKADLERSAFFDGKFVRFEWTLPFNTLFDGLITDLHRLRGAASADQDFVDAIISTLQAQKIEVDLFKNGNPDLMRMKTDLINQGKFFISKGEFVIEGSQDDTRYLDLPNIRNLVNPRETSKQKIINNSLGFDYLSSLAEIDHTANEDKLRSLVADALKEVTFSSYDFHYYKDWCALLRTVYVLMRKQNKSLPEAFPDDNALNQILSYLCVDDDNSYDWDDELINAVVYSVLKQIIGFCEMPKVATFTSCYQRAFSDYLKSSSDSDDEDNLLRTHSYQLFILQLFLYLLVIQMRCKGGEQSKQFLKLIGNEERLNTLVSDLCRNESSFMNWMNEQFQISVEEYQSVAAATHEIATAHIEAPHFDEVRIACTPEVVCDSKYTVLGGRLCWSPVSITECSLIDSPAAQANLMEDHFDLFITQSHNYVSYENIYSLMIQQLENSDVFDFIEDNIDYLPHFYKERVLTHALEQGKIGCVELLLKKQIYVPRKFEEIIDNKELVELFLKHDSRYAIQIPIDFLIKAINQNDLDLVRLYVTHCPGLLNQRADEYPPTALMHACMRLNAPIIEYLLDNGADIHAQTSDSVKAYGFIRFDGFIGWNALGIRDLFFNYKKDLEVKFQNDPDSNTKFTKEHLVSALEGGDFKLVSLFLRYCPHITNSLEPSLVNQIKRTQKESYWREFESLLSSLERDTLLCNTNITCPKVWEKFRELHVDLSSAGERFFNQPITADSYNLFKKQCIDAIEKARPELEKHSGWYSLNHILRGILGVISALVVIPALCVHFASKDGYVTTFFGRPFQFKIDPSCKLKKIENELHQDVLQFSLI